MAAFAAEHGHPTDAAAMVRWDENEYVHLKNTSYADPQLFAEGDRRVPREDRDYDDEGDGRPEGGHGKAGDGVTDPEPVGASTIYPENDAD